MLLTLKRLEAPGSLDVYGVDIEVGDILMETGGQEVGMGCGTFRGLTGRVIKSGV